MRKHTFFFVCLFFLVTSLVQGQYSYQVQQQSGGNPGGLNTDADFDLTGWTTVLVGGQMTNVWSASQILPFPFYLFGQSVSLFKVSANGVITFDISHSGLPGENENLPSTSLPDLSIACFWEKFANAPPIGTNDVVQYKTYGSFPNRQLWIRWYSYEWGPTSFVYVAAVLEESTNKVYMVDMYSSPTSSWITSTVGVQQHANFAVQYGNSNVALSPLGSTHQDNQYYEMTPFLIPPQDLTPVEVSHPQGNSCGLGMENISFRVTNIGQQSASNLLAAYSVNDGPPINWESIPSSLAPGDTTTYTFATPANMSTPGEYAIKVWVKGTGDTNIGNDSISVNVSNIEEISSFPYYEDFELGDGGWEAGGNFSSWEWGIPANPTIQGGASGHRAWITNRFGNYNSFENSWVVSPCFDLSGLSADTWISMKLWWETESSWDGAAIQASLDQGETWQSVGSYGAPDWYNWQYIASLPGGQTSGWSGWAPTNDGAGTWIPVTHKLDSSLIGQSSVRFRIAFAASGSQNSDGVAFDDFAIGTPPQLSLGSDGYYCEGKVVDPGSLPGVSYQWSTGSSSSTQILVNATGNPIIDSMLTVVATDSNGLFRRDTLRFSMAIPLGIASVSPSPILCGGDNTGAIDITPIGGLAPYSYQWNSGQTVQDPDQLFAGTYLVSISDAIGCSIQSDSIVVEESVPLALEATVDAISCYGEMDGEISLAGNGGNTPYQIQWTHGPTAYVLSGLAEGSYQAILTDALGCQDSVSVVLQQPDSLNLQVDAIIDASCQDTPDGSIQISVDGGTEPYQVLWSDGSTSEDLIGTIPGTYSVSLTDTNGCSIDPQTYVIGYQDSLPRAMFEYRVEGATVFFMEGSTGAASYYWDFGFQTPPSSTGNPVLVYPMNGSYDVTFIVNNDCGADTMIQTIVLSTVGIESLLGEGEMTLFPNPVRTQLELKFEQVHLKQVSAHLYNPGGQLIHTQPLGDIRGTTARTLAIPAGLTSGIYFLKLSSTEGSLFRRIVVI